VKDEGVYKHHRIPARLFSRVWVASHWSGGKACSDRCRAALTWRKRAEAEDDRDREVCELLERTLAKRDVP
jgi:hypothetical protein